MTDKEFIKAELQKLQKILEARADMYIGNDNWNKATNLLSFATACSGALELLKEQEEQIKPVIFSGGVMIQNKEDKRAWVCGVGPEPTLERMKAEIEKYRKIHVVLCAWARENDKIVWFENHTNALGMVDYKFID